MAESAVSFAVEKLCDLIIQEGKFLGGVTQKVEEMQTELKLMQSFLKDADKRKDDDERVCHWVSEIREAAYDAEDVLEIFALKIASRRGGGIQNAFKRYAYFINEAIELHKVRSKIEAIKTRISNLTTSLQTYGITRKSEGEDSSSAHGTQQQARRSYSHVVEEYTVGLDGDIKNLVAQLVNEEKHCRVVSIWGMGGLGKTTLAKKIYHHRVIRHHFDGFAWAYVSQQCRIRDVWEGVIFNIMSPSKEQREQIVKLKDEELTEKLYQLQLEKKCLVILDDIWSISAWDSLSPAFPVGMAGSKMLLTTRNKEVAEHVADGRGFLHELRCLTEEEGWELLKNKAFPTKDFPGFIINRVMEELGRKMVRSCAGLPLAIVVLGGLLATKHTFNEWTMVHENIHSYLKGGRGHVKQHSGVSTVLALSYDELPYQLKPCFLHLGHFPEDFNIPTKKLVRIWVAEGIVSRMQGEVEGEEKMEDVAEHYLGELLDRSMVQVGVRGSTRRAKTCRLHDLMRDLCLSKANQENFLKIVHLQDRNKQEDSLSSMVRLTNSAHRVHRLTVYLGEETLKFFPEQESAPYLRSLFFFNTGNCYIENFQEMKSKFSNFKLLKILDLERCPIPGTLPREIGNLIHLWYLSLDCSCITNIPSTIGNLRCLQTLILQNGFEIRVPNVIWKMEQLRHLYLFISTGRCGKLKLGNLSNLQTLRGFATESFDVKELTNFTNLRKLGIFPFKGIKELEGILISPTVTFNHLHSLIIFWVKSIVEETDLRRLLLSCHHLYKLSLEGRIEKLPEFHQFPPNLTKLTLRGSELEEDPMATLERLPNLSILRFYGEVFIGKEMICSSKGFVQLKSLVLMELPYLEEWRVGEGAMPGLIELAIEGCKNLKRVPDGVRFITTLQELQIIRMPAEFENRLRMEDGGGEDHYKVQHVPSIIIQ